MAGRDPRRPEEFETIADGRTASPAVSDSRPSSVPLPPSSDQMTIEMGPDSPTILSAGPVSPPAGYSISGEALLSPGAILGQRYEILQVLGRGGKIGRASCRERV